MKFDYFDALERLATKACVGSSDADAEAEEIMRHLATDFITPIDRADIARITLSLRRCACFEERWVSRSNASVDRLCEAVEAYVRGLRQVGKRGGKISARLFLERSRSARADIKNEDERRRVEALCECCEMLICAVMNNI